MYSFYTPHRLRMTMKRDILILNPTHHVSRQDLSNMQCKQTHVHICRVPHLITFSMPNSKVMYSGGNAQTDAAYTWMEAVINQNKHGPGTILYPAWLFLRNRMRPVHYACTPSSCLQQESLLLPRLFAFNQPVSLAARGKRNKY